jgi:hypothetical protein
MTYRIPCSFLVYRDFGAETGSIATAHTTKFNSAHQFEVVAPPGSAVVELSKHRPQECGDGAFWGDAITGIVLIGAERR